MAERNDSKGVTVEARMRQAGWLEFKDVTAVVVDEDGWVRLYQRDEAVPVMLNHADLLMLGAAKNFSKL